MAEQKTSPESLPPPPSHSAAPPQQDETGATAIMKSLGLFLFLPIALLLLIKWLMGM